jgi:ribose transport system substrate-binding protein
VFVAADLSNADIAAVARGVQQAADAIDWPLEILDGQGSFTGQRQALGVALKAKPGGIILGGFDAAPLERALAKARAQGIPVIGWHAAREPGASRSRDLFTNVSAAPQAIARLTANYVIADSHGRAGVVIFTDSAHSFYSYLATLIGSDLRKCRSCSVLEKIDTPIAGASIQTAGLVTGLMQRFGRRFTYTVAVNGAYAQGAGTALIGAGRSGTQPPFSVVASGGDASQFERIRAGQYQKATIAEPLNFQGWQLIDELNRARARQRPSGYLAPPSLITQANVPDGGSFDPASGYRKNYLRIWGR